MITSQRKNNTEMASSGCCSHETLHRIDTELTADTVEYLAGPSSSVAYEDNGFFASGCYQLVKGEESDSRIGKTTIHRLDKKSGQLEEVAREDGAGVLDLKWRPGDKSCQPHSPALLAQARSDGKLRVLKFSSQRNGESEQESGSFSCSLEEEACWIPPEGDRLSTAIGFAVDWQPNVPGSSSGTTGRIAMCDTAGGLSIFSPEMNQRELSWVGHDLECWICCFDRWSPETTLYSGSDDALLRVWDLRTMDNSGDKATAVLTSKKHQAGVCSLACHPHKEHIMASGSYDEYVRVWDTRNMRNPISQHATGGGVWRVKWCPIPPSPSSAASSLDPSNLLLTASMYVGFALIDTASSNRDEPLYRYTEHRESGLAYGIDWGCCSINQKEEQGQETLEAMVGSCSFYDKSLHLWRLNLSMNQ